MVPVHDCTVSEDRTNTARRFDDLRPGYQSIHDRIQELGLDVANVFINEYPNGTTATDGMPCNDVGNLAEPFNYINSNESARAGELIRDLNQIIREQASALSNNGWHAITGLHDRFVGHGFCAGNTRWLRLFNESMSVQGNWTGAMHPNGQGHRQYGEVIFDALRTLVPPPTPRLGTVGNPDKALGIEVDPKNIRLRWQANARATIVQIAYRPLTSGSDRPHGSPAEVVADPPRLKHEVNGWRYLPDARASLGMFDHEVTAASFDYSIRACTDAACSAWTELLHVSNVVPAEPSALVPDRVFNIGIKVRWTPGLANDPTRTAYELGWLRRGETTWHYQQVPPGFTAYTVNVGSGGTYHFWLRACGPALCSDWTSTRISNLPPQTPSPVTLGTAPWPFVGFTSYSWQDLSDNEVAFQIFLYDKNTRSYTIHETDENDRDHYNNRRAYAWVRACSDLGCSPLRGTMSPTQDIMDWVHVPKTGGFSFNKTPTKKWLEKANMIPAPRKLPKPSRRLAYGFPVLPPTNTWPR